MSDRGVVSGRGVVTLQGQEVEYLLVRMRSRKRLAVLVDAAGELQVRVPWRVTLAETERFIHAHDTWILCRLQDRHRAMVARPPLQEGVLLPFLDESLRLCYGVTQIRPVVRSGDCLWVVATDRSPLALAALLERWYRQQAQRYLSATLQTWSGKMEVQFGRLTIRDQKSRWGSCSAKKTISLNWRLMFFPAAVVEYVVVHELCHLHHMDHSPAFWAMVASLVPEYAACRRQLRLVPRPW